MYLGYVRVSTGKQTVENQMYAIEDFCAHQNPPIQIDDWIIETASGMKHFDKRKLGKKLQSVTSDDTIISTEITRLLSSPPRRMSTRMGSSSRASATFSLHSTAHTPPRSR